MFSNIGNIALTQRLQYIVLSMNAIAILSNWLASSYIQFLYRQDSLPRRSLLVDILEASFASWIPIINKTFYGFSNLGEHSIATMFLVALSLSWFLADIFTIIFLFLIYRNGRKSIQGLAKSDKMKIVSFKARRLHQDPIPRSLRVICSSIAVFISTLILFWVFWAPSRLSNIGVEDLMVYSMSPFACLMVYSFVGLSQRIEWVERITGDYSKSDYQEPS